MIRDDHSQMMSDDELIRLSNELRDLVAFTPEEIKALNESCQQSIEELENELRDLVLTPEEIKAMNDLFPTPEDIKAMNESFRIAEELRSAPENLQ